MKLNVRTRLLATTFVFGAMSIATPAYAQSADDQSEPQAGPVEATTTAPDVNAQGNPDAAAEGEIVVTGSRISRPNLESTSPVTVLGSQEIEQTGTTRVEDLVNALPQAVAGQTAFVSNGATGTATVDLRGLGSARTLVLVNGRRLQPGSPLLPSADLNQIPASLIERIEVVTGGASSVYGADAVSGVVNFIMDTDFRGFQIDSTYSFYQHDNGNNQIVDSVGGNDFTIIDRLNQRGFDYPTGNKVDGQIWDTTVTLGAGTDDGRGRLVAYIGHRQVKPILQRDRDHSACALSLLGSGRIVCGGSATAPLATVADLSFGNFFFASAGPGAFQDYQGPYNFAPINYFQRPDRRYTAGAFAEYEVTESFKPFAEFMFMDDRSVAQIAESGTFFADVINLRCDSPLLSPAQGAELCASIDGQAGAGDPEEDGVVPILIGKRNVEGGPRQSDLRHTSYRAVVGARGDITQNVRYELSGQYGTTVYAQTYLNDFSRSRLLNALDATTDAEGNLICSNTQAAGCVPYNPFQGSGIVTDPRLGITQAALDYVQTPGFQRGETEEYIAQGFITGQLGNLWASEPVGIVVGAEYRKTSINLSVDTAFATGDLAGQGGPQPNVFGEIEVKEAFTEVLIPILSDLQFANSLSLELGYRISDYNTSGKTDTYKIQGTYEPIPAIRLRGGYNRAVRSPNVLNLFTPQSLGLFAGSDPCAGENPEFTLEQCQRTGVTAAQYGTIAASPADQYNQITGGNQGLEPEKADTWTAGIVIEPRNILPGFALTVDYFKIKIDQAIQAVGAQTILRTCGLSGQLCELVQRNPISGDIFVGSDQSNPNVGRVINVTQNIGGVSTSGIDVGASYTRPIFGGRVNVDFQGTYLDELEFDTGANPGVNGLDGSYDCAGFTGSTCGTPTPEWRHFVRAGYTATNGLGFSVRWRHIGSVKLDEFSEDPDLADTTPDARGNIRSFDWFDVTLNANVTENFRMILGVNNVFDKDPPLRPSSFGTDNANTWAGTYDPVGRYFFASGTLRF